MRLLKLKIRKAQEARLKKPNLDSTQSTTDSKQSINIKYEEPCFPTKEDFKLASHVYPSSDEVEDSQPKRRRRTTVRAPKKEGAQCTKNIVINFGKAIASFASSDLATPYLENIVQKEGILLSDFTDYIRQAKESIGGIDSFRHLLLVTEQDDAKTSALKRTLSQIGVVFIKFFSVNWICHGRVTHKIVYLKYRNKMLRRIQRPEFFTYIKEHKKKK